MGNDQAEKAGSPLVALLKALRAGGKPSSKATEMSSTVVDISHHARSAVMEGAILWRQPLSLHIQLHVPIGLGR